MATAAPSTFSKSSTRTSKTRLHSRAAATPSTGTAAGCPSGGRAVSTRASGTMVQTYAICQESGEKNSMNSTASSSTA